MNENENQTYKSKDYVKDYNKIIIVLIKQNY